MPIQFTRRRLFNLLLIGTLALGIGSFNIQPAAAQLNRSTFLKTARELDLSRSQMRKVARIMRGFQSDMKDILTSEQLELLQSERQQRSQTQREELREALDLTDTQSEQLASARQEMVAKLEGVLTPNQVTGMIQRLGFNRF